MNETLLPISMNTMAPAALPVAASPGDAGTDFQALMTQVVAQQTPMAAMPGIVPAQTEGVLPLGPAATPLPWGGGEAAQPSLPQIPAITELSSPTPTVSVPTEGVQSPIDVLHGASPLETPPPTPVIELEDGVSTPPGLAEEAPDQPVTPPVVALPVNMPMPQRPAKSGGKDMLGNAVPTPDEPMVDDAPAQSETPELEEAVESAEMLPDLVVAVPILVAPQADAPIAVPVPVTPQPDAPVEQADSQPAMPRMPVAVEAEPAPTAQQPAEPTILSTVQPPQQAEMGVSMPALRAESPAPVMPPEQLGGSQPSTSPVGEPVSATSAMPQAPVAVIPSRQPVMDSQPVVSSETPDLPSATPVTVTSSATPFVVPSVEAPAAVTEITASVLPEASPVVAASQQGPVMAQASVARKQTTSMPLQSADGSGDEVVAAPVATQEALPAKAVIESIGPVQPETAQDVRRASTPQPLPVEIPHTLPASETPVRVASPTAQAIPQLFDPIPAPMPQQAGAEQPIAQPAPSPVAGDIVDPITIITPPSSLSSDVEMPIMPITVVSETIQPDTPQPQMPLPEPVQQVAEGKAPITPVTGEQRDIAEQAQPGRPRTRRSALADERPVAQPSGNAPVTGQEAFGDMVGATRTQRAASATPAESAVTAAHVIKQVADVAATHVKQGRHDITLRLDPPELGPVRLLISSRPGGEVTAHIAAASAGVVELLDARLGQLRDALTDAGVQVGQCSVSLQMQTGQSGSGRNPQGQAPMPEWQPAQPMTRDLAPEAPAALLGETPRLRRASGLDFFA